jgi:hypothetical protein
MRLEDYSRLLHKYLHRVSRQGASRDPGMDLNYLGDHRRLLNLLNAEHTCPVAIPYACVCLRK